MVPPKAMTLKYCQDTERSAAAFILQRANCGRPIPHWLHEWWLVMHETPFVQNLSVQKSSQLFSHGATEASRHRQFDVILKLYRKVVAGNQQLLNGIEADPM